MRTWRKMAIIIVVGAIVGGIAAIVGEMLGVQGALMGGVAGVTGALAYSWRGAKRSS